MSPYCVPIGWQVHCGLTLEAQGSPGSRELIAQPLCTRSLSRSEKDPKEQCLLPCWASSWLRRHHERQAALLILEGRKGQSHGSRERGIRLQREEILERARLLDEGRG